MFQLFTGSFRRLEAAFLSDLRAERRKDPLSNLLVLSPSGRLLTRLQSRLAEQHPGLLNIHCLTFYALAERLLAEAAYTETVVTEPALYAEMIRRILTGKNPEPVDLAIRQALHSEGKPVPRGLAGALSATLKDLRDAGMRADKAIQAAQEGFLGGEAPEAAPTLALYARVAGLFEKHNLRSSADLLRRAAKEAPGHRWLRRQKMIFLYGFYDLTGVQLDLVLSLANHPDARVYFPYEEGNPAYTFAEKLLFDPAFTSKVSVNRPHPNEEKGRVEEPLTRSSDVWRPTSPQGEVIPEIWSCSGARDEVWLAAKEILKLTDEGVPYSEIAVIARNTSPYLAALREIFGAHRIPYVSSRQEPAGSHPLVKTIRTLLTLDEKHPRAKTLREDLEKSPYTRLSPGFAVPSPTIEANWTGHIADAAGIIRQCIRLPKDASAEESSLLEAVLATIEDLRVLERLGGTVSRRHFLDTWQEKLDGLERPAGEKPHAGVHVLEVQQARGLSFQSIFLLGMNEKVFPRLIREDPFLSDAARASLAQAIGCRLGRKLDGYNEERFLFTLMRSAATRHLHLLTQRSDEEGKARVPSAYLKDLEREMPAAEPARIPRSTAEKFEQRPPLTWTPKELSFLVNRAQMDPRTLYQALSWDTAGYDRLLRTHHALETFRTGLGAYDGVLSDPALVRKTLESPFSPTSLEQLAQCPFQYYADHVLRIPIDEDLAPEGEMTPQALGQLFHKTLELFYTACREMGFPKKEAEVAARLQEASESCFKEFTERLSTVYPLALRATKELINKELLIFLKTDIEECTRTGYTPRWFEQPIAGTLAPGGIPYLFHGNPDRLDVKEGVGTTEVRVVDYKSGKPKPWTGRIETQIIQGRFLQLPIYLGLAGAFAEKALGLKVSATAATLRPVRETDEEATEKTITADFWSSPSAPLFIENIKELIGVIEKEKFYIKPSTGEWGYCTRCDFAMICRKEHMPTRIRAERDPLRQRVSEKLERTAPPAKANAAAPV